MLKEISTASHLQDKRDIRKQGFNGNRLMEGRRVLERILLQKKICEGLF